MNIDVTKSMMEAIKQGSDGAFQSAAAALGQTQEALREDIQKKTAVQVMAIINNLAGGGQLSTDEIALVRIWIVGDAESYIKAENDYILWTAEYQRLVGVLQGFENKECSEQDALRLIGILEDAIRVSFDIANFLEKKERIFKFDQSLADGVDADEKEILVRVLTGKFRSADC